MPAGSFFGNFIPAKHRPEESRFFSACREKFHVENSKWRIHSYHIGSQVDRHFAEIGTQINLAKLRNISGGING